MHKEQNMLRITGGKWVYRRKYSESVNAFAGARFCLSNLGTMRWYSREALGIYGIHGRF